MMINMEWVKRVSALRFGDPATRVHELMSYLQAQGFKAPKRIDQLDDEDPLDVTDGAEYSLTYTPEFKWDDFCMVNFSIDTDQKLTDFGMTWVLGKSDKSEDIVRFLKVSTNEIESLLGAPYVKIDQGEEWLEFGTPEKASIASFTWADNISESVQVKTATEYLDEVSKVDTAFSIQFLTNWVEGDEDHNDQWFLQAIMSL